MSDREPYESTPEYILLNVSLSSLNECEKEYVTKYRSVLKTLYILSDDKQSICNEIASTNNTHCSKYRRLTNNLLKIDTTIEFLSCHTLQNLKESKPIQEVLHRMRFCSIQTVDNAPNIAQRILNWFKSFRNSKNNKSTDERNWF